MTLGFGNIVNAPRDHKQQGYISQAFFRNVIDFETCAFIFANKFLAHLILGIHLQYFGR